MPNRRSALPPTAAAMGIIVAGAVSIAVRFPGDPWLLFGQLIALGAAVGPAIWTARRAATEALWWLPTAVFGWAALAPLEPWLPHATGDGYDCGRLTSIPTSIGNAYLSWIESWGYGLPAVLLLAGSAWAAWRQRSWELAAWTLLGAFALAVLWTLGRPHDCD